MTRWLLSVALVVLSGGGLATLSAQPAGRDARLSVTVIDQTGAVIPEATVTLVGLETATKAATLPPKKSSGTGIANFDGLVPGRYSITAEFTGFELGLVRDVRLRSGDNKHVVVLALKSLQETVTVGGNAQEVAAARASNAFGLALSNDQIGALSDDPAEALQQLNDLAGANAVIRVDSFEGQQLPPKAQIKAIHVTRDQFAAETPQPGSTFVDVITQPGIGPIRGTTTISFRDNGLSAVSPFTTTKGPEQLRNYAANIGGALIKEKSNFSLALNGRNEYTTPLLNAALPDGTKAETLSVRAPHTQNAVNALLDYALTKDQTLRLGFADYTDHFDNLGVGGFNLPEHGFSLRANNYQFRALEAGPIGRRAFINTRVTAQWFDQSDHSAVEAPTIVVQDSFTSGGAQQAGGQHGRQIQVASDIDFIQGIHSWRTGGIVYLNQYRLDDTSNYLGTYTFANLADYQAGRPLLYTRQIGNPAVDFGMNYGGVYLQDDVRVHRGLTLSLGVRYSFFDIGDDHLNIQPRVGITWAPFKNGKTTFRSSFGTFPSSPNAYIIGQALRFNGVREQEVDLVNPSYPDPGPVSAVAGNQYRLGDYQLERDIRYSGGVDQRFSPRFSVNALYNYYRATHLQRGANLNPPVNDVRADPSAANIFSVLSDGQIIRHEVYVNFSLAFVTPSPAASRQVFNWRRLTLNGGYAFIHGRRDVMGPFDIPPSGSLNDEWGRAPADNPYRINLNLTSTQLKNFSAVFAMLATDGSPYNETTGLDDNHDGVLNDRPAGVGIFSLRGAPQFTLNGRFTYTVPFSAAHPAVAGGPEAPARYRLGFFVNVINITDHANYGGYSGIQTSPFFEQPTLVINPRKVDIGMNISF